MVESSGGRRALLLPGIPSIETAAEQVYLTKRKADIHPDELVRAVSLRGRRAEVGVRDSGTRRISLGQGIMSAMNDAILPASVERRWLGLILVGYVILAVTYSLVNPVFESPDEIHHYAYVDYLHQENALPVAELGSAVNEFHQPPLYYLLTRAAIVPTWLSSGGPQNDPQPYDAIRATRFGPIG